MCHGSPQRHEAAAPDPHLLHCPCGTQVMECNAICRNDPCANTCDVCCMSSQSLHNPCFGQRCSPLLIHSMTTKVYWHHNIWKVKRHEGSFIRCCLAVVSRQDPTEQLTTVPSVSRMTHERPKNSAGYVRETDHAVKWFKSRTLFAVTFSNCGRTSWTMCVTLCQCWTCRWVCGFHVERRDASSKMRLKSVTCSDHGRIEAHVVL